MARSNSEGAIWHHVRSGYFGEDVGIMVKPFVSKEISWLHFNERVLQEAADPSVPLMERLKFLAIFSSNMDEFFRVRVATLHRLLKIRNKAIEVIGQDPQQILDEIQKIVLRQTAWFEDMYQQILKQLADDEIYLLRETELNQEQRKFALDYFQKKVRPFLVPLMLTSKTAPLMKDSPIYLAVSLVRRDSGEPDHALIQIPADKTARFLILPRTGKRVDIILLEDIIRLGLEEIFFYFDYVSFNAYVVKMTRDSELDMDDERFKTFPQKVQDGLAKRKSGKPVRFVYDREMPKTFLRHLRKLFAITRASSCIPGGRYHNFKDFINFPHIDRPGYYYEDNFHPAAHPDIKPGKSILDHIGAGDLLFYFPYHSFEHFIDLLRESAIDPRVTTIRMTVYRLARDSQIANVLVNAAQNGKKVFVVVELQARFDEEANLFWSERLREEGVEVVHGLPSLKVHSKLCLITRHEGDKKVRYGCVGTGNFHEGTAKLYTDHLLMTADQRITAEVHKVFELFNSKYRIPMFRHLIVSPFQTRNKIRRLIKAEIKAAKAGHEAWMDIKINNLSDPETVGLLYAASQAGVHVRIIARSMFSAVPGLTGVSENIAAISIVDRFLEHSRFYIFCNAGKPVYFIASGDWLPRNFDRRVEVAAPLYSPKLQQQLRACFDLQWRDNCKARVWDKEFSNQVRPRKKNEEQVRAQLAFMTKANFTH
ncbi:MAG: polyphosphate kinase 1 [Desulfuromonas sp.]|nr:polyphosphate kinase 1 [Desulfuromonas sp.]